MTTLSSLGDTMGVLDGPTHSASPEYTMAGRDGDDIPSHTPGPGAYIRNAPGRIGNAPEWSMPGRDGGDPQSFTPGPGAYYDSEEQGIGGAVAYSFGCASGDRSLGHPTNVPGPGAYTGPVVSKRIGSAPEYTMAGRDGDDAPSHTPGPGAYYDGGEKGIGHAAAYSFGLASGERSLANVTDVPGPGAYHSPREKGIGRAVAYSFGLASAERSLANATDVPGPGMYSGHAAVGPTAAAYSFGIEEATRGPPVSYESPGPGAYEHRQSAQNLRHSSGPSYTISGKHAVPSGATATPAAGAYESVDCHRTRAAAFTIAGRPAAGARGDPKFDTGPGPGAYSDPQSAYLATQHPSSPRHSMAAKTKTAAAIGTAAASPGPGAYEAAPAGSTRAAAYTMSGKHSPRAAGAEATPGPIYDPQRACLHTAKTRAPAFTMAGKRGAASSRSAGSLLGVPGPGAYQPRGSTFGSKRWGSTSTKGTMGRPASARSLRHGRQPDAGCTPGPGAYHLGGSLGTTRHSSSAYSIGKKLDPNAASGAHSTPGPGSHDPLSPRTRAAAYTMGSKAAPRSHGLGADTPGPIYDPNKTGHCSPRYHMQGRYKERRVDHTPGPGTYSDSDMTRTGNRPIAKGSEVWVRQLARPSTAPRTMDVAHRY